MMISKLSFYRAEDGYRWRTVAPNYEITGASTQGFSNFTDCRDNYGMVATAAMYDRLSSIEVADIRGLPKQPVEEVQDMARRLAAKNADPLSSARSEAIANLTCRVKDPLEPQAPIVYPTTPEN